MMRRAAGDYILLIIVIAGCLWAHFVGQSGFSVVFLILALGVICFGVLEQNRKDVGSPVRDAEDLQPGPHREQSAEFSVHPSVSGVARQRIQKVLDVFVFLFILVSTSVWIVVGLLFLLTRC
jgi:hypothetical protein